MHSNLTVESLMLRLHYVPGSHGSHGSPKRSSPWCFDLFCLRIQVLLRLVMLSHGLSFSWDIKKMRTNPTYLYINPLSRNPGSAPGALIICDFDGKVDTLSKITCHPLSKISSQTNILHY